MDDCRICLSAAPEKYLNQLKTHKKFGSKGYSEILLFCLNIQISDESGTKEKLCTKCFTKTLSFYKFKLMALKNDAYIKSVNPSKPKLSQNFDKSVKEIKNEVSDESEIDEFELNNSEPTIIPPVQSDAISNNDISVTDHKMKYETTLESEIDEIKCEVLIDDVRETDEDWLLPEDEDYDMDDNLEITKDEDIPDNSVKHSIKTEKKKPTKTTHKQKRNQEATILTKPGICDLCGANVRNLETHSLVHLPKSQRKMFPCKLCSKSFLTASAKSRHHSLAHLGKIGHCDTCNKDYADLKFHNLTIHNPQQMRYECGVCFVRFPYSSNLDKHMRRHTKEKPFQCETCGKEFMLKSLLDNHVRSIHNQEKNFPCKICSKSFFKKCHFERHMRTHTKEKPYVCNDCGQSYSASESLRVHQLAAHNNNVRNYSCQLCEKTFKTASTLNAHKKTHTNEKPFLCPHCHMRYGRLFDMQRHVLKNHQKTLTSQHKMDIDSP